MTNPYVLPTIALLALVVVMFTSVESWLWRYRTGSLPPVRERLGRHPMTHEQRARGLRTFRGWLWAGCTLIISGIALMWWFDSIGLMADGYGLIMAVIASGLLAWTIGGGIGVVRANDPPEGSGRRMPPLKEREVIPPHRSEWH